MLTARKNRLDFFISKNNYIELKKLFWFHLLEIIEIRSFNRLKKSFFLQKFSCTSMTMGSYSQAVSWDRKTNKILKLSKNSLIIVSVINMKIISQKLALKKIIRE
ncbi:hypothetical protein BpHYR1_049409 [Brachionus plicatilis]|uniref:Uncharacterized protein n=1 Tax=Brachionus plicatilis TaxID=10195 RepID=A0A3M7SC71_BRAPC|nr:hypothetical protein BpHYR1_049409 [Brachionus plicatilis]